MGKVPDVPCSAESERRWAILKLWLPITYKVKLTVENDIFHSFADIELADTHPDKLAQRLTDILQTLDRTLLPDETEQEGEDT